MYLAKPDAAEGGPAQSLVAFRRVTIGPGKTAEVDLPVPTTAFASFDEHGNTRLLPGRHVVTAGGCSPIQGTLMDQPPCCVETRFVM